MVDTMKNLGLILAIGCFTFGANGVARPASTQSSPKLQIQFEDSDNWVSESQKTLLLSNINAAFNNWAAKFKSSATVITRVKMTTTTATGRVDCASITNIAIKQVGVYTVAEESAAYKIRTGQAVVPGQADMLIQIDPGFLSQELWLDPKPTQRVDPVPSTKTDAISLFTHEFAHAFGMQTFRDLQTGVTNPSWMTVYDQFVNIGANGFTFEGPNSNSIVLTSTNYTQNIRHLGNSLSDPLASDLMGGLVFYRGTRYNISNVDLGIMRDLGLPLKK